MGNNLIYKVREASKVHPSWSSSAVMYELNTRQFTEEGTFRAAEGHLHRLKEMGVDILWMMPIHPIGKIRRKGSLGSYYSISDYVGVNPEFGDLGDFRSFVSKAHSLGMYVILDWVANHTARDARWCLEHPNWYEWDKERGEIATPFDWSDTAKLDYSVAEMRGAMLDSMKYWLREADVDGFRCDMAMLVPLDFWERATKELTREMSSRGRELYMLAEAEGAEFHRAFDATYSWEEHHILNKIVTGELGCYDLGERLGLENSQFPMMAHRMHFTSNHDENSWNGSALERMGVGAAKAMAALTFVLSGIPLIYSGQECGLGRRLEFFDKDVIDWGALDSEFGGSFNVLYRDLCRLKHSSRALCAGSEGGDLEAVSNSMPWRVFAVRRSLEDSEVLALFNMGESDVDVEFYGDDLSDGGWRDFRGDGLLERFAVNESVVMRGWEFRIYSRG